MIGINVKSNASAFLASVTGLKNREMKRAVVMALNRTAASVQTEAIREIRKTYNVTATELRRGFTIRRAWEGRMVAEVRASGKNLNVIGFGARQTKRGVSFAVKAGTRKTLPGSFVMTIKSTGYTGVFMRAKEGGKLVGRYPIKAVTTVSVPGMFSNDAIEQALQGVAADRFTKELRAAVRAIELRKMS